MPAIRQRRNCCCKRAVKLNRYDAASWIQLGFLLELANNLPQAEDALSQAASVDSTFLPNWSLANFTFVRGMPARFWYWAERAAQMVPDDATPLFRLAWYVNPNAQEIGKPATNEKAGHRRPNL